MACMSESAANHLESCAFFCIKRKAWGLRHNDVIYACYFSFTRSVCAVWFGRFVRQRRLRKGCSWFLLCPGICYHSSEVRNNVSFSLTSSLNHRRPVLFNVGWIFVEIAFIKERHHSEYVCPRKRMTLNVFSL